MGKPTKKRYREDNGLQVSAPVCPILEKKQVLSQSLTDICQTESLTFEELRAYAIESVRASKDEHLNIVGILLHPLIFVLIWVGDLPYHILHENCSYQERQDKEQTVFEELLHRFSELKVNKCLARTGIAGNNHDDDVIDAPTHKPIVERLHIGEL